MAKKKGRSTRPQTLSQRQCDELDALYAQLPKIECRGQCWDSCTSIQMTALEHRRAEQAGVVIPDSRIDGGGMRVCPALTMLHQCAVYEVRPAVCRLWGLMETLPCNYGCRPENGRLLTDEEADEFLARVCDIAGEHAEAEFRRRPWRVNPERARQMSAEFARRRRDAELADDVRRKRVIASGAPVLYVRGRGHVSSQPPASGANS